MKFFENSSKSEEGQARMQQESEKQESLEKKLDELILVGRAIFTIIKQEKEERQAAHESLESMIQAATSEMIHAQEKAMETIAACSQENSREITHAVSEEIVKLQKVTAVSQKHFLAAAEELNSSILDNTSVLEQKLGKLGNSLKNGSVSAAAVVSAEPEIAVPELDFAIPEPETAALELELTIPEPDITIPEPEIKVPEPEIAVPESDLVIPEPEIQKKAPAPVSDDPNRAMTPEEIAALIASMN